MTRRKDGLDTDRLADAEERRQVFQALAKGDIARAARLGDHEAIVGVLERVFSVGVDPKAQDANYETDDRSLIPLADVDLAHDVLGGVRMIRLALFGHTAPGLPGTLSPGHVMALALYRPADMDDWVVTGHVDRSDVPSETVTAMSKLGLLKMGGESDGLRTAMINAWGYELLRTGVTAMPEDRDGFITRTDAEFHSLLSDFLNSEAVLAAADVLGIGDDGSMRGTAPR